MAKIRITIEANIDSPQYPAEKPEDLPFLRENLGQLFWGAALEALQANMRHLVYRSKVEEQLKDDPERLRQCKVTGRHLIWSNHDDVQVMQDLLKGMTVEILEPGPARPLVYEEFDTYDA